MCDFGAVESELHFIVQCEAYSVERQVLYQHINTKHGYFDALGDQEKLSIILNQKDICKYVSIFINKASFIRTALI